MPDPNIISPPPEDPAIERDYERAQRDTLPKLVACYREIMEDLPEAMRDGDWEFEPLTLLRWAIEACGVDAKRVLEEME